VSAPEKTQADLEPHAPVAPWYPPPTYPPPKEHVEGSGGGRAVTALVAAIFGIVLGLPLGVPGMVLGTLAYFLGKSAANRIDSSGAPGGRGVAVSAWVLGVVAMAIGSAVSLVWLVVLLVLTSGPTTTG
jgi:hypothetical protein